MERLVVLLPTYNEIDNLEAIIGAISAAQPTSAMCVIDDHSPDGTGVLAEQMARRDPRLHVLRRPGKAGLGRAYLHGFRWALAHPDRFTHVVQMDADLSHDPGYLSDLLQACRDGADVALGSRYVHGGGITGWRWDRRMLSRGGSLYARWVLGVDVCDLTGGYKCFTRAALERLDLDAIHTVGYGFQIEVTFRSLLAGSNVVEVPIIFPDRVRGVSKMSMKIFWEGATSVWKLRSVVAR